MKPIQTVLLLSLLSIAPAKGQGVIIIAPVPVTNGLTGTLADSSILAGVYYGPPGTSQDLLLLLTPTSHLVNGYARFDSPIVVPGFPSGSAIDVQIRAWSSPYSTYEQAIGSGLPSVLAGKSLPGNGITGDVMSPPPTLILPGFTIEPVPEASPAALGLFGAGLLWLWRQRKRVRPD